MTLTRARKPTRASVWRPRRNCRRTSRPRRRKSTPSRNCSRRIRFISSTWNTSSRKTRSSSWTSTRAGFSRARRWSDGLHQAVEAKEGVAIERETQTLATITIQNYFRLYQKLAGMTGTAETEATEFLDIYKLGVVTIPTNKPNIRKDGHDSIYKTKREKFNAVAKEIKELHAKGRPILVGTVSVETSEMLSRMLKREGLIHSVLNAKYHQQEAEIVARAGQRGAVTIATNMARSEERRVG